MFSLLRSIVLFIKLLLLVFFVCNGNNSVIRIQRQNAKFLHLLINKLQRVSQTFRLPVYLDFGNNFFLIFVDLNYDFIFYLESKSIVKKHVFQAASDSSTQLVSKNVYTKFYNTRFSLYSMLNSHGLSPLVDWCF